MVWVVGLTLTSSLWKQITQTHSYLRTNNCHRLVELMVTVRSKGYVNGQAGFEFLMRALCSPRVTRAGR